MGCGGSVSVVQNGHLGFALKANASHVGVFVHGNHASSESDPSVSTFQMNNAYQVKINDRQEARIPECTDWIEVVPHDLQQALGRIDVLARHNKIIFRQRQSRLVGSEGDKLA